MNAGTAVAYFSFGNSSVNVNRMFALKYNNVIVCVCVSVQAYPLSS